MVWIPAGTLIVGTPVGQLPRIPDEELPGVEVDMRGFFIDEYNQPGEPGALPLTNVTQAQARGLCEKQGKRLCTELEWERACKGPENRKHEYGDDYDPSACGLGINEALSPNGVNPRCVSGFGVRDMHGSAWNWTSSAWGRGANDNRVTVRGGNSVHGEVIGRCANGKGITPTARSHNIGVRCCAGEVNTGVVSLSVKRGSALKWRPPNKKIAAQLLRLIPKSITKVVRGRPAADQFSIQRVWEWRPVGNEELLVGGGCAHPPGHDLCGVVVARVKPDGAERLGYVSSDWWIPTMGSHDSPRTLYILGGDKEGAFRKAVTYEWGRISEGGKWRRRSDGWHAPR